MRPLPLDFPLRFGDSHEKLDVFDRYPACEDLHGVFKVRFEDDVAHAVNERRRRRVEDVETLAEGAHVAVLVIRPFAGNGDVVCVAEEHEHVPDAELGGEWDGVVEQREIPPGTVRSGWDSEFILCVIFVSLRAPL